jgi:hypothetical protein
MGGSVKVGTANERRRAVEVFRSIYVRGDSDEMLEVRAESFFVAAFLDGCLDRPNKRDKLIKAYERVNYDVWYHTGKRKRDKK